MEGQKINFFFFYSKSRNWCTVCCTTAMSSSVTDRLFHCETREKRGSAKSRNMVNYVNYVRLTRLLSFLNNRAEPDGDCQLGMVCYFLYFLPGATLIFSLLLIFQLMPKQTCSSKLNRTHLRNCHLGLSMLSEARFKSCWKNPLKNPSNTHTDDLVMEAKKAKCAFTLHSPALQNPQTG